jgi:fructose PTS system EIIA component
MVNGGFELTESVFCQELIRAQYMAVDKKSLLKEMVEQLNEKRVISSVEDFFQVVWTREKVMSTGIGRSVALPHGCHETVDRFVVSVWQLAEPLPYDSIDEKPVQLIFLLAVPLQKQSSYMRVLAGISNFIRIEGNIALMTGAKDATGIYEILSGINLEI